jgi:cold shock protein
MSSKGVVKFFNERRGFGFIKPDSLTADVYVHISTVRNSGLEKLSEGQRVIFKFDTGKAGMGPAAFDVAIA